MELSILFHHFRGHGGFGAGTRQAAKPGTAETPVKRSGTASEEVGGEGLPVFPWNLGCHCLSGQRACWSEDKNPNFPLGQIPNINTPALLKCIFLFIFLSPQSPKALLNNSVSKLALHYSM